MKKCPKCGADMFESMEPKVSNLSGVNTKLPRQTKMWRCSKCGYKEPAK